MVFESFLGQVTYTFVLDLWLCIYVIICISAGVGISMYIHMYTCEYGFELNLAK